jgi:hypothetical protein
MAEVRFVGPPALVSALAQMLEEEGLTATFDPPFEGRAICPDFAVEVVVYVALKTGDVAIEAGVKALAERAIAKFEARFPRGNATVEDDEDF